MKKFKVFDVWMSIALIIASFVITILGNSFSFMYGYFIVGGWQIISMLTHVCSDNWVTQPTSARKVYGWITIISLVSIPIGGYIILLFLAPFMAIYYTYMCYEETYVKMKRPLDDLR